MQKKRSPFQTHPPLYRPGGRTLYCSAHSGFSCREHLAGHRSAGGRPSAQSIGDKAVAGLEMKFNQVQDGFQKLEYQLGLETPAAPWNTAASADPHTVLYRNSDFHRLKSQPHWFFSRPRPRLSRILRSPTLHANPNSCGGRLLSPLWVLQMEKGSGQPISRMRKVIPWLTGLSCSRILTDLILWLRSWRLT